MLLLEALRSTILVVMQLYGLLYKNRRGEYLYKERLFAIDNKMCIGG